MGRNIYTAHRRYINSDEALPWGLVAPEASKIIPCSRQHHTDGRRRGEKSYESLEGERRERLDVQLQERLLAVEQLA